MNTDLHYAIKQLKPIVVGNTFNHLVIMDRVRRALDALERMAEEEAKVECTGRTDPNNPTIYDCNDLMCPIHGERNRSIR